MWKLYGFMNFCKLKNAWTYIICTLTKLKNSQILLLKKNFENSKNIKFGKL